MIQTMAKKHEQTRPKVTVQVRVSADAVDRLDDLALRTGRSRSELINFSAMEWSDLELGELEKRIQRQIAKSK